MSSRAGAIQRCRLRSVCLAFGFVAPFLALFFHNAASARQLGEIVIHVLPTKQTPDDGYWTWLRRYVPMHEEAEARTAEIRFALSVLAQKAVKQRAQWQRLYQAEYSAYEKVDTGQEFGLLDWASKLLGPDDSPTTKLSSTAIQRNRDWRSRIKAAIDGIKGEQRRLIDGGMALLDGLEASVRGQMAKSGDRRPQLAGEAAWIADAKAMTRIAFYDSAGWTRENELPRLLAAIDPAQMADEAMTLLMRAMSSLALARNLEQRLWLQSLAPTRQPVDADLLRSTLVQRLGALKDLRRIVHLVPGNDYARAMLRDEELYWVRQIAAKVERERQFNLQGFEDYLAQRGFRPGAPGTWPEWVSEVWGTYFGFGPIGGFLAAQQGVPYAAAHQVGLVQRQAARNFIALNAIIRLIKNGVPLPRIMSLRPEDIAERMILHRTDGLTLAPDQARQFFADIHSTMRELPDLAALASDEDVASNTRFFFVDRVEDAFARDYFDAVEADYRGYELIGDLFSVRNLMTLFGPHALTRVSANRWGLASQAAVAAAREGQFTVGHALFRGMRLQQMGEVLSKTGAGRWFRYHVIQDLRFMSSLGRAAREAWAAGGWSRAEAVVRASALGARHAARFAGIMALMAGAHFAAEETNIPGLVLLVDMIDSFELHENFARVLARTNTPVAHLRRGVGRLQDVVDQNRRRLAEASETLEEMSRTGRPPRGHQTVEAGATRKVDTGGPAQAPRKVGRVPHNRGEAVEHAVEEASTAARQGDSEEARRAAGSGQTLAREREEELAALSQRTTQATRRLDEAPVGRQHEVPPPSPPPTAAQAAANSSNARGYLLDNAIYETPAGPWAQRGDEALRRNRFDRALEQYHLALDIAEGAEPPDADVIRALNERIALVESAQGARTAYMNARRASPPLTAREPIPPEQARSVMDRLQAILDRHGDDLSRIPVQRDGKGEFLALFDGDGNRYVMRLSSANPVIELTDTSGNEYVVKLIGSSEAAQKEVFGAVTMAEAGLNVPAAARGDGNGRKLTVAGKGERNLNDVVISRKLGNAQTLEGLPESHLLALKQDIAAQRAARAAIGDADGHLGNILIDDHGNVWNIDFDQASFEVDTQGRQLLGQYGDRAAQSPADGIEATIQFAHGKKVDSMGDDVQAWFDRAVLDHVGYKVQRRADQLLHIDDMAEQIRKLEELDLDAYRQKLIDAGIDPARADTMKQVLSERVAVLRETLGSEKLFGGSRPIHLSLYLLFREMRRAGLLKPARAFDGNVVPLVPTNGMRSAVRRRQAA